MYGMDQTGYQTAYGGPFSGGDLATTIMPPMVPGYEKFDLYPAGPDDKGDQAKAKESSDRVRSAERLQHQHDLPLRPAEREGDRRGVPAGAQPRRDQPDA